MAANWSLSALDRLEIQELYARCAWVSTSAMRRWRSPPSRKTPGSITCGRDVCRGHEAIRKNLESLWYDRQSWWYGRQHMMNHFIMDALEEEGTARVRCFFQILQFNVEYRNNFVFGIGTRDDVLAKVNGRWVFKALTVNAWTEMDQVPWKAELRMKPCPKVPPKDEK